MHEIGALIVFLSDNSVTTQKYNCQLVTNSSIWLLRNHTKSIVTIYRLCKSSSSKSRRHHLRDRVNAATKWRHFKLVYKLRWGSSGSSTVAVMSITYLPHVPVFYSSDLVGACDPELVGHTHTRRLLKITVDLKERSARFRVLFKWTRGASDRELVKHTHTRRLLKITVDVKQTSQDISKKKDKEESWARFRVLFNWPSGSLRPGAGQTHVHTFFTQNNGRFKIN